MNPKPLVLVLVGLLAGTAIIGIPMLEQEPDSAPDLTDRKTSQEQPAADHLPYARTIDSTSILFNITNHSPSPQTVKLVLSRSEKLPAFFHIGAELFHNDGNWTNLLAGKWTGYTGGAGRGVVALHADPVSFEGPVVEVPLPSLGRAESYAADGQAHIEPGSHHLFVTVQNVDMELFILMENPDEQVTIDIVQEDPDMDRMLWAHVPGHWDEVDMEFYGAFGLAGAIDASTAVKMKNSYRSIHMMASGDYAEIQATDEEKSCSATSTDWPPRRSLSFKPAKGAVTLEAVNVAASSIAIALAHVRDIPVEWEGFNESCFVA